MEQDEEKAKFYTIGPALVKLASKYFNFFSINIVGYLDNQITQPFEKRGCIYLFSTSLKLPNLSCPVCLQFVFG